MGTGSERIRRTAAVVVAAVVLALVSAGSASANPGDINPRGGGTNQWCVTEDGTDGNGNEGACIDGFGLGEGVSQLEVTPDGSRLQVLGFNGFGSSGDSIITLDRDESSGFVSFPNRLRTCISPAAYANCPAGGTNGMDGPTGLAVSPDSRDVYATARVSNSLHAWHFVGLPDPVDAGPLQPMTTPFGCFLDTVSVSCTDTETLTRAADVVVAPDGEFVYTAGNHPDGGGITAFQRASDGHLTKVAGPTGCINDTGSNDCANGQYVEPWQMDLSRDGENLYAASIGSTNNSLTVFDVAADGTITQKAGVAGCFTASGSGGDCTAVPSLDLAVDVSVSPDGKSVYVATDLSGFEDAPDVAPLVAFERSVETGALEFSDCFAADGALGCIEVAGLYRPISVFATDEAVYVGSQERNADQISGEGAAPSAMVILNRDPSNGSLSQEPFEGCWAADFLENCVELSTLFRPRSFDVSPDGDNLYVGGNSGVTVFDRDDGNAPLVSIADGPPAETTETEASFSFSADKPVEYFECAIDSDLFQECTSPATFQSLSLGPHTVKVKAFDFFGHESEAPAEQTFTVVAEPSCETDESLCPPTCETDPSLCPPPTCETDPSLCPPEDKIVKATVTAAKVQKIKGRKILVAIKVRAGEALSVKATGSVKKGRRKAAFKPVNRRVKANTTTTLKLRPARAAAGRLVAAGLLGGKRAVPKLFITLTDGASNRLVKRPKVTVKGPKR